MGFGITLFYGWKPAFEGEIIGFSTGRAFRALNGVKFNAFTTENMFWSKNCLELVPGKNLGLRFTPTTGNPFLRITYLELI